MTRFEFSVYSGFHCRQSDSVRSILLGESFIACTQEEAQEYVESLKTVRLLSLPLKLALLAKPRLCRKPLPSWPALYLKWMPSRLSGLACALPCMLASGTLLAWMMPRSDVSSGGCCESRAGVQTQPCRCAALQAGTVRDQTQPATSHHKSRMLCYGVPWLV